MVPRGRPKRGLTLHPTKTKIVDAETDGFEFLGYRFVKHRRFPRKKSLAKFRGRDPRQTRRTNGHSLSVIIADLNSYVCAAGSNTSNTVATGQPSRTSTDGFECDLRSILRKRADGRKGRGRGLDHNRYPNAFFAEHGLLSLAETHARECQPLKRKPQA
jgi:RNA-directed DNA polymerase